jgi:hypothetical protein
VQNATEQDWQVDGRHAGTWTTARNLTWVKVANASHMVMPVPIWIWWAELTHNRRRQVPFDVPAAAHDMLLRFQGVDVLSAPRVPSRVGDSELGTVLEPTTQPAADSGGPDSTATPPTAAAASPKSDTIREAYYNAGSAALILVIIFAGLALFVYLRSRAGKLGGGGGGGDGLDGAARGLMRIPGFGSTARPVLPRRRRRGGVGTGDASVHPERAGRRLWGKGEAEEGEPQELDELVRGDGTADDVEDDDEDGGGEDLETGGRGGYTRKEKGKGVAGAAKAEGGRLQQGGEEEDMFSLGLADSDEEKEVH